MSIKKSKLIKRERGYKMKYDRLRLNDKNINIKYMSDVLNISKQTIYNLNDNELNNNIKNYLRIAIYLNISLDKFFDADIQNIRNEILKKEKEKLNEILENARENLNETKTI